MLDLLIRNARICDGTGAPSFMGDLGVRNGLIRSVGRGNGQTAERVIDADGLALAPGFVDPHTHYDAQIAWDPLATCSPWHGVTTVIMGNCGVGVAPVRPETREILMQDLVNVEAIPYDVMKAGIDWQWESYGQYLDAIDRRGLGINVAGLVAFTPLRHYVMGEASLDIYRNDCVVGQMIDRAVEQTLQGGFVVDPNTGDEVLDAELKARWDEEAQDPECCDPGGELTFHDQEELALRAMFVPGDIFCVAIDGGETHELREQHRCRAPSRTSGWRRRFGLSKISFEAWPRMQRKPRLSGLSGSPRTLVTFPFSTSTSMPQSVGWQFIGHIVREVVIGRGTASRGS